MVGPLTWRFFILITKKKYANNNKFAQGFGVTNMNFYLIMNLIIMWLRSNRFNELTV